MLASNKIQVSLFDMVASLSDVTDLLLHNYDGLNKLRVKVQADLNGAYVDMNSHPDTFQINGNGIKAGNKPREEKIYVN